MDDKFLNSPLPSEHLVDLDVPTGREFIAGSTSILANPEFFLANSAATVSNFLYSQLEYSAEYGRCLCTLYGPIVAISRTRNIELTPAERLELVKRRVASPDFQKDVGGFIQT